LYVHQKGHRMHKNTHFETQRLQNFNPSRSGEGDTSSLSPRHTEVLIRPCMAVFVIFLLRCGVGCQRPRDPSNRALKACTYHNHLKLSRICSEYGAIYAPLFRCGIFQTWDFHPKSLGVLLKATAQMSRAEPTDIGYCVRMMLV